MALRTEEEIKKAVKESIDKERDLRDRFEADYGKWRLESYNRGRDYKSFTSNKPLTLADLIIDFLVRGNQQIRIPIDKEIEAERKNLNNAERLLIGLLKLNDLRLGAMVMPDLVSQMAWHSVVRGWYALRVYIKKNEDGSTQAVIDCWDRFHTHYDMGSEGLLWVCHTRVANKAQIKAEYNIDVAGTNIFNFWHKDKGRIYDFWDDEVKAVIVDGKFVLGPEPHGVNHIPCRIIAAGATPFIESEKYRDTIKDVGESWLAANRNLVEPLNELYSDLLTIVARGAKIPLGGYGTQGGLVLDDSPYRLDRTQAIVIPLDRDKQQEIKPLMEPTMPKDAAVTANVFSTQWQEGGVPESVYGQLGFQISGYALSQLREGLNKAIGRGLGAIERGGDWLLRELLSQFKTGFKSVKVEGKDSRNKYFGPVELSPSDVDGDWFPEFRLKAQLPEDEVAKWQMARIAKEGDNPLWSNHSINDILLGVQDPDLEEDLKALERAKRLPPVELRRFATILAKQGRPDLAQEVMNMLAQMMQPPAQPGGGAETGMSNTVFPPAELGGAPPVPGQTAMSPDQERLARLGLVEGR